MYANKGFFSFKRWRFPFMMFLSALISMISLYIIRILLVADSENSAIGYAQS